MNNEDPGEALRMSAFTVLSRLQSGTEEVVRLDEALKAVAMERERCAKVCEAIAQTGPEASYTAGKCIAAIRRA